MDARLEVMERKLREAFEIKSGYGDPTAQARLLQRHFKSFDSDGSGIIDFDEFSRAMVKLNFVGVQAEVEALFDRFDQDLNGFISYAEFSEVICGQGSSVALNNRTKSLLERVKERILDAGGKNGFRTLGVILRRMDQNGNGVIEIDEFRDGLLSLGVDNMDEAELEHVFQYFDRDNSGKITVDELMRGLRGSMSKRRILIVKEAFARLDTSGDGTATLEEVERLYDPSHHPEVLAGRLRPRDALLEFMRVFEDSSTCDGQISWSEFLAYYKDLSAGIINDDEFELMIRNAWHISGGKGWCANSSCRRVLVTYRDGSQAVAEIENDLGISGKDKSKLIRQLQQQGHRGIVDITLSY
ncbi:TPA: hypothetical protein N0F65_008471 [Lagenidium giganteum]|uniref:EF-hand domain-containing protein n=1 Tax=Lagenidium giganteum TaxID=4803 RepID=A0AAV2Z655_9STRA|nr:TPA: hypothetical protein N0F65_008471 [Lagenidium giganteum]